MAARRRRRILLALLALTTVLVVADLVRRSATDDPRNAAHEPGTQASAVGDGVSPSPSTLPSGSPTSPSPSVDPPPVVPQRGSGEFTTATGGTGVLGHAGDLYRYRAQVEIVDSVPAYDAEEFAEMVDATLGDSRSWIAGGGVSFQRTESGPWDFTIYLATPDTVDELCAGIDTGGYTSCRNGDRVVINLARWQLSVEHWDADLVTYRQYVINHEVGHRIGERHQRCPGQGEPAPVMQQQTLTLAECRGNAWPYVDGEEHSGELGSY